MDRRLYSDFHEAIISNEAFKAVQWKSCSEIAAQKYTMSYQCILGYFKTLQ